MDKDLSECALFCDQDKLTLDYLLSNNQMFKIWFSCYNLNENLSLIFCASLDS